jgi:hypothetical protein
VGERGRPTAAEIPGASLDSRVVFLVRPAEWTASEVLRAVDFADYDAFARRVVALRRAGKPVLIKIER